MLTPQLVGVGTSEHADSLPFASTLCGACYDACPVRIDIPEMLVHLRAKVVDAHRGGVPKPEALAMKGAQLVFGSPRRLAIAERLGAIGGRIARNRRRAVAAGTGEEVDGSAGRAGAGARNRSGPGGGRRDGDER